MLHRLYRHIGSDRHELFVYTLFHNDLPTCPPIVYRFLAHECARKKVSWAFTINCLSLNRNSLRQRIIDFVRSSDIILAGPFVRYITSVVPSGSEQQLIDIYPFNRDSFQYALCGETHKHYDYVKGMHNPVYYMFYHESEAVVKPDFVRSCNQWVKRLLENDEHVGPCIVFSMSHTRISFSIDNVTYVMFCLIYYARLSTELFKLFDLDEIAQTIARKQCTWRRDSKWGYMNTIRKPFKELLTDSTVKRFIGVVEKYVHRER